MYLTAITLFHQFYHQTWDLDSGEYERTLKGHTNAIQSLAFNRAGTMLASCSSDISIKLWDFNTGSNYECLRTLRGHDHNISGLQFLPNGEQVVSCSRYTKWPPSIYWSLPSTELLPSYPTHYPFSHPLLSPLTLPLPL